jgi:hypothetical protein
MVYMYVCMYVSMFLCFYVSMFLCTYVCPYVCTYVCMYVYVYVCMYILDVYKYLYYFKELRSKHSLSLLCTQHAWITFCPKWNLKGRCERTQPVQICILQKLATPLWLDATWNIFITFLLPSFWSLNSLQPIVHFVKHFFTYFQCVKLECLSTTCTCSLI